ncbi:MAG: FN3 associated domain-containing protein [Eubacterium sp.]
MDKNLENTEELLVENNREKNNRKKILIISVVFILIIIIGVTFIFYQKNMKVIKALELGAKYLDEEKYEKAVLNYEKVIVMDNKKIEAYEGMAEGQIGLKNYDEAEKTIEIVQKIEMTDYSKILMADVYSNTKRDDEAKKLLSDVKVNLETGNVRVINHLASVYNQLKYYTDAIEILETTIRKSTEKEMLKKLYDKLIDTYIKAGKSNVDIEKLLEQAAKDTEDDRYTKQKEKLLVKKPTFSQQPGEFHKEFELELKRSDDKNSIYYTLDGTEPTKGSSQYEKPIPIKKGSVIVKAIEINLNGTKSEVASGTFSILINPEEVFIENISGMWGCYKPFPNPNNGASEITYIFRKGSFDYNEGKKDFKSGGGSGDGYSAEYTVTELNDTGTIGTLTLHNIQKGGINAPVTRSINCGTLGDGKIIINGVEFLYYADGQSKLSKMN